MIYKNFSKYDIDIEKGTIFSNAYNKRRNLKLSETPDGYIRCGVTDDKGNIYHRLHQVVFCAVNGITKDEWPVDENGVKYEIDHIDTNKKNNTPENLRLVSKKDQMNNPLTKKVFSNSTKKRMLKKENREKIAMALLNRKDESKKVDQYTVNGDFIAVYDSMSEASRCVGVSLSKVSQCCKGTRKTAGGYKWKYSSI